MKAERAGHKHALAEVSGENELKDASFALLLLYLAEVSGENELKGDMLLGGLEALRYQARMS